MSKPTENRPRAVLGGVQLPDVSDLEHATHLAGLPGAPLRAGRTVHVRSLPAAVAKLVRRFEA